MILEAIEELVARCEAAGTGVNALLPTVPRGEGVAAPPLLAGVRDELRHPWVTRGAVIDKDAVTDGPILVVQQLEDVTIPLAVGEIGDVPVSLALRYAASGQAKAVAWNARQTLRCVARILATWAVEPPGDPVVRGGVRLNRPGPLVLGALYREDGSDILVAPALVTFSVFDPWVLGAT